MMTILIMSTMIFGVCLSSIGLWERAKPRGAAILLGGAIVCVAQVLGITLALAWLGKLERTPVVVTTVLLDAILIGMNYRRLSQVLLRLLNDARVGLADLQQSKVALTIWTIAVTLWILIFGLGVLLPPTDWDGLAQHIPIAAFHLQSGNLARIETPYRGIHAYPANGSLLMAWSILVTGNDTAVDLVQWPFWLLGTLAVYHLARLAGAARANATLGSAIFTLAPVVILQARAAYVDLILAGLVLISLALIMDQRLPTPYVAIVTACALGVLLGLKYAGAINAILLGALLIARIILEYRLSRAAVTNLVLVMLPVLLLGGYWYLSNWLDLANPFWPIAPQLGGVRLFEGVWTPDSFYENALPQELLGLSYPLQLWTVWLEPTSLNAPDVRLGGLGPLWLVIGLPCTAFYLLQTLRHQDRTGASLLGFAVAAFLLTPADWHTRYVIAPIAVSGVATGVILENMDRWPQMTLRWLIVSFSLYSAAIPLSQGSVRAAEVVRFARLPMIERRAVFADRTIANQPALRWFDQNVPENTTVAYGWEGVILYPLWGQAHMRKIVYIPTAYPPIWFDRLRADGVEYLVTRQGSAEAQFAAFDPRFRSVYSDSDYEIYFLQY